MRRSIICDEPLTRVDMQDMSCSSCGDASEHLILDNNCHPDVGYDVIYVKSKGAVVLVCKECDRVGSAFYVQPAPLS